MAQQGQIRGGGEEERQGFVIGAKFIVPTAVLTDIVIKADHEQGKLHVQATHLFVWGWNTSPFRAGSQRRHARRLRKGADRQQSEIRKYRVAGAPGTFR